MYRWSVEYTGRALRPHRTITGKGEIKAGGLHTAMYRAASVIPDGDRKQAISINVHLTRLNRIPSLSERRRSQDRIAERLNQFGTKALSELLP